MSQAPPPAAYSEANCTLLGVEPCAWREFCRRLCVPVVEVARGLCVALASDVTGAISRLGKPLPRRQRAASAPANDTDDEGAALEAAGLRRRAR